MSQGLRKEDQLPSDNMNRDALTARIDRLEGLLLSVVANGAQSLQPATIGISRSSIMPDTNSNKLEGTRDPQGGDDKERGGELDQVEGGALGVMKVDKIQNRTLYLGGAHWVSIMCEIEEFRSYLATNAKEMEHDALKEHRSSSKASEYSISLLRGTTVPATWENLLCHVPPRAVADRLLARFFYCHSVTFHIIHEPTFRKEVSQIGQELRFSNLKPYKYAEHWTDPLRTTLTWLGLLFVMLHLAELSYELAEEEPLGDHRVVGEYKKQAIKCLVASDFTNPVAYTIEALMLYVEAEWMGTPDAGIEVSLVLGMVIRLAMRMGMHRDSRAHPGITPFHGEMRRRVWAVLHKADILYSFQLSLPTTIRQSDCDCALPRNIYDDEFEENSIELPPSRPLTEVTEVSYTIAKYQLLLVLGRILEVSESRDDISSAAVLKYENALHEVREQTPPHLLLHSANEQTKVPENLIQQRINLDRIHQLGQCILHRKFLAQARRDPTFMQYRRSCIDAAMALLGHQANLCSEWNLAELQNTKKRHMYAIIAHDFYNAGMAIALDLHFGFKCEPSTPSSHDISLWGIDRRAEMIAALEASNHFWGIAKAESIEASKAHGMFSFVLAKAKTAQLRIGAQIKAKPTVFDDVSHEPQTVCFEHELETEGAEGLPDFDWNLFDAYNGDLEGLESFLQWPPMDLDNLPAPNIAEPF